MSAIFRILLNFKVIGQSHRSFLAELQNKLGQAIGKIPQT